jgi:mRNA-degrading endonuclease RelE of RelBE toxin-antitoxin system
LPEAEEVYRRLNASAAHSKADRSILRAIGRKVELIKANPHYGNPMAKNLIPEEYRRRYGADNLFRVELPNFWRMLYTLTDGESEVEIIAFVLGIGDHRKYDRLLGYR